MRLFDFRRERLRYDLAALSYAFDTVWYGVPMFCKLFYVRCCVRDRDKALAMMEKDREFGRMMIERGEHLQQWYARLSKG